MLVSVAAIEFSSCGAEVVGDLPFEFEWQECAVANTAPDIAATNAV